MGRENISVENQNARRAKALAGDAVASRRRQPAGYDEGQPDDRAYHHPHGWCDQVVFEGILHEENDPEEKNEAADPREKFDPKKCFPIDCLSRGTRRRRRRKVSRVATAAARWGRTVGRAGSETTGGGGETCGETARGMVGPGGGETASGMGALVSVRTGAAGATTPRSRDSSAPMRPPSSRTAFFSLWISTTPTTIKTIGSSKTASPRQIYASSVAASITVLK